MNGPSKASPIATGQLPSCLTSLCAVVLLAGLIVCIGCGGGPALFLSAREREIKDSTQAIEIARDDAQRAKAYSSRGAAYSEKARYIRLSKLISNDKYGRLFDLAMKDHTQAVALNPNRRRGLLQPVADVIRSGQPGLDLRTQPFEAKPATHGSTRRSWISRRPPKRIPKIPPRLTGAA